MGELLLSLALPTIIAGLVLTFITLIVGLINRKLGLVLLVPCVLCFVLFFVFLHVGEDMKSSQSDGSEPVPSEVGPSIVEILREVGYTAEHAADIERTLNSVGITGIEIENMSGEAESGLNSMVCYANGSDEDIRRFTVTTEDGVVFYVGFRGEDLYDSNQGGVLKQYSDVHIPDTEISTGMEMTLMMMAEDVAKAIANYPATVDFKTLYWGFWRNDYVYAVQGTFTCTNAFGVEGEHVLRLVCEQNEETLQISAKEVYLDGTLIKSAE